MAKLLKLRRGTTSQHNTFTGAEGEVTIDTTKDTAVVHDGSTTGGTPLAKEDMSNVSSASIAGRLGTDSIATTKIAGGALPTDVTVASANLGTPGVTAGAYGSSSAIPIVTVNNKGQVTAASTTAIDSTTIANGSASVAVSNNGPITSNANHDFSAGIDVTGNITATGTLSSDNITITGGQPRIRLNDSGQNPDYSILNEDGVFGIYDDTNSAHRLQVNTDGHVDVTGNLDVGAGVDVTGTTTTENLLVTKSSGNASISVTSNDGIGSLEVGGQTGCFIDLKTPASDDYDIRFVSDGYIYAKSDINLSPQTGNVINARKNFNALEGLDVTGNITVSGTVDGINIAVRDTLFGNLTTNNGVLKNGVTATTQSAGDNSTKVATTAYTDTAVANLVDSSPGALNTLNELAAAINDDASFSTTMTNNLATKMPLAGGEFTGNVTCENIVPDSDSSRNLGSNSVRFANVYADNFYGSGANLTGAFLSGMIMMYNSSSAPSGWYLCNGSNGTPDLRDRFIVGAGNSYSHGATGGSVTATDNVSINVSVSGSTSGGGSHSFNAGIFRPASHTVASSGHQHSWSGSGSGSDTVSIDTRSPYYALTFIMKS